MKYNAGDVIAPSYSNQTHGDGNLHHRQDRVSYYPMWIILEVTDHRSYRPAYEQAMAIVHEMDGSVVEAVIFDDLILMMRFPTESAKRLRMLLLKPSAPYRSSERLSMDGIREASQAAWTAPSPGRGCSKSRRQASSLFSRSGREERSCLRSLL